MAITETIDQIVNRTKDEKLAIQKSFKAKPLSKRELWIKEGEYGNHIGRDGL